MVLTFLTLMSGRRVEVPCKYGDLVAQSVYCMCE